MTDSDFAQEGSDDERSPSDEELALNPPAEYVDVDNFEAEIVAYDQADGADRFERFGDLGDKCVSCGWSAVQTYAAWICPNCGERNDPYGSTG
jgi:rubrerythrin